MLLGRHSELERLRKNKATEQRRISSAVCVMAWQKRDTAGPKSVYDADDMLFDDLVDRVVMIPAFARYVRP